MADGMISMMWCVSTVPAFVALPAHSPSDFA